MSEEVAYAPVTYTVKGGKNYDRPWCVFHGTPSEIRRHAIDMFGLDESQVNGLSPAEVMKVVEEILQGVSTVGEVLGATVLTKPSEAATAPSEGASDPWAGVDETPEAAAEEVNPHANLIERLNHAQSENDLKVLWAKNKPAFEDESVKDAYKKRRAALAA